MPAKVKRAKIKVEEVEESPKVEVKEVTPEKTTPKTESVPKVTSFSQLDSSTDYTPAPVEPSQVAKEEVEPTPTPATTSTDTEVTESESEGEMESSTDVKEWLKDIRPDTTKDVEKGGNGFNGRLFFGLLIVFILLGALAGGLFYYKQRVSPGMDTQPSTQEPTTAPTVTPTPEVEVNLTSYSLNVLNGSGTAGEANVVKSLLTTAGFDADKVKTGNAGTYDFKNTEVKVKVDVPTSVTDAIIKALGDKYTVEVLKENLAASSPYDVVVTVGAKK